MIRLLPFALVLLTGCNGLCALVGDYTGTYEGDENGNVTLSITDDKGETLLSVDLEGDIAANASGAIGCDDGSFSYALVDADGNEVGDISGLVDEAQTAAGEYTTADGGAGTWSASAGE